MPNFELMLWIILALWLVNGIMDILAGIALDGDIKRYSALGGVVSGIVSILLVIIVLTVR